MSDPTQGESKATSELDPNSLLRSDVFQGRRRVTEWKEKVEAVQKRKGTQTEKKRRDSGV
jgi:hypothetical protein